MDNTENLELTRQIRKDKFNNLTWTPRENIFVRRPAFRSKRLQGYEVPFSVAVCVKFRRSCFGTYLAEFNCQQDQDKYLNDNKLGITLWNMKETTPSEKLLYNEDNNLTDDLLMMLRAAVKQEDYITMKFLYEHLVTLRLDNYHITAIDEELKSFRNLQVIIMTGNWIKSVPGGHLPRKLQFLECFANEISSLGSFCTNPPVGLLHVGFGRNRLTDESKFRKMHTSGRFDALRTLDLSDNDIYSVATVLEPLRELPALRALELEGNPCAVCMAYKDAVLTYLPHLIYLDNTQILEKDRVSGQISESDLNSAALTFTCHRIMGLPPFPKEKGLVQSIHFEITLPLLEEIITEVPEEVEEVEEEKKELKSGKNAGKKAGKDKASSKSSKSDKKSKGSSKKKGKVAAFSPYQAPDEYEAERKSRIRNTAFKTERVPWSKMLQYPEEALTIEPPEKNLTALRDTFRSSVVVKIIYLKVQPPQKEKAGKKKPKKKDKGKGKDKKKESKKGKGSKGSKKGGDKTPVEPEKPKEIKEPQETILKKVTLATFKCDLRNVNWSDKTIDYYWANHPKCHRKAISVEGSLRAINYVDKKGKKKDENKNKKNKEEKSDKGGADNEIKKVPSKEFFPPIFTCQVGFGVKRSD